MYLGQFVLSVSLVCQKQRVGPDSENGTGQDCCSTHSGKVTNPFNDWHTRKKAHVESGMKIGSTKCLREKNN